MYASEKSAIDATVVTDLSFPCVLASARRFQNIQISPLHVACLAVDIELAMKLHPLLVGAMQRRQEKMTGEVSSSASHSELAAQQEGS